MLKRKIYDELITWKNGPKDKILLIKGLRQVGKTFIIKEFCENHYENLVYINFKKQKSLRSLFDGDLVVDDIVLSLSASIPNSKFIPNKTIIFFDEIQECSRARAALKSFLEDKRFDVIASGSLLGLRNYNSKINQDVPVGCERTLTMHGLDFEEFLWARGISEDVISLLKKHYQEETPIPLSIHNVMFKYFREYIIVGGLPSNVNEFLSSNNFNNVLKNQRDLIEEYKDDFGKHLDKNENEVVNINLLTKIEEVFNSVPSQLTKKNKKFQYSNISSKAKGRDYYSSIQWLDEYGLIKRSYNLQSLEGPLEGNKNPDIFKVFMTDSGLLVSMLEHGSAASILSGDMLIYKGAIFENIIADCLIKNEEPLYYYHKSSGLETDFVIRKNMQTIIIEVKSSTGNAKSASTILNNESLYHVNKCIKLGEYNIGRKEKVLTLPYYLTFLIKED